MNIEHVESYLELKHLLDSLKAVIDINDWSNENREAFLKHASEALPLEDELSFTLIVPNSPDSDWFIRKKERKSFIKYAWKKSTGEVYLQTYFITEEDVEHLQIGNYQILDKKFFFGMLRYSLGFKRSYFFTTTDLLSTSENTVRLIKKEECPRLFSPFMELLTSFQ